MKRFHAGERSSLAASRSLGYEKLLREINNASLYSSLKRQRWRRRRQIDQIWIRQCRSQKTLLYSAALLTMYSALSLVVPIKTNTSAFFLLHQLTSVTDITYTYFILKIYIEVYVHVLNVHLTNCLFLWIPLCIIILYVTVK